MPGPTVHLPDRPAGGKGPGATSPIPRSSRPMTSSPSIVQTGVSTSSTATAPIPTTTSTSSSSSSTRRSRDAIKCSFSGPATGTPPSRPSEPSATRCGPTTSSAPSSDSIRAERTSSSSLPTPHRSHQPRVRPQARRPELPLLEHYVPRSGLRLGADIHYQRVHAGNVPAHVRRVPGIRSAGDPPNGLERGRSVAHGHTRVLRELGLVLAAGGRSDSIPFPAIPAVRSI